MANSQFRLLIEVDLSDGSCYSRLAELLEHHGIHPLIEHLSDNKSKIYVEDHDEGTGLYCLSLLDTKGLRHNLS